jgi:NAD+ diphosphatase
LTLDRRDEWRIDSDRVRAAWSDARVLVVDEQGQVPTDGKGLAALSARDLAPALHERASLLGVQDGQSWFALPASLLPTDLLQAQPGWAGLRDAAAQWSRFESGLFAYAKALLLWQSRARHCGACGQATALIRAGHCARCSNAACGLTQFPRTDAAIIVIVTDGDRCLLGRQPGWPSRRYSTLAGFVEPGESLEDAVRREVREEAGVQVGACHYQSSQPWPFPGALMVGFRAEAADTSIRLGDELEDARWFQAEQLIDMARAGETLLPPAISVSRRLLEDWLQDLLGAQALQGLNQN